MNRSGPARRTVARGACAIAAGVLTLAACTTAENASSDGTGGFTATLPGPADSPAVYLANVPTAAGPRNLLFLTTKNGTAVAVDARDGTVVWQAQDGPGACRINNGRQPCYTTSAPAVDPSGDFVYSYGLDGRVHKRATGTGTEVTAFGWPELATTKPFDEKGSAHLTVATARSGRSYLYVASGGYLGDRGDYQGHLTTIDLATGGQTVFNTVCSDQAVHFVSAPGTPDCGRVQAAVWARPGVVYDPGTDRVYLATGNGAYDGSRNFGDSVLALNPDGTGSGGGPVDFYTPSNQVQLDEGDLDLGSAAPAILPDRATTPLAVQAGKDGMLRLLDLADLGGHRRVNPDGTGGEVQIVPVPETGEVLAQPATWRDPEGRSWVFVANGRGLSGLEVVTVDGTPALTSRWTTDGGGTSPIVVDGVVYYLTDAGAVGLDPATGKRIWADNAGDIALHWQSLVAADGYLYYPDGTGQLHADRLPTSH
ncbi:PQQ-binding-like beta-propeller repeat protein [Rhodococcus sp. NPDC127528]|uniref:outer membrane protein assembly factor BamB family protein n=1 Tax=unclassified Rhodococcus (in: high G+C Gram-positive bacteria) TaxID=192944 RepID=UPI003626E8F2